MKFLFKRSIYNEKAFIYSNIKLTTILIAGSSSGIGYELASLYLSKNYHVIGIARNSPSNFANHQNIFISKLT